jgi:hypothetical protein
MFDISIGESDRRRGGMMLPSMWNAAGITSAEAQVSPLTERAVVLLLTGTFLRRGGNTSLLWVLRQCSLARSSKT